MTEPSLPPGRRFNEKEVAQIIKRASELQQDEAPAEPTNGMSLAELEQVAREAGLDPALVRRAATDLDTRITDRHPSPFIGAPTTLRIERTIDGEVSPDEYETMVLEMQNIVGQIGSASTIGRSLQWTSFGVRRRNVSTRTVQVTITPRNGRTTIQIHEPLGQLAGGLFGGLMGGMGGGLSGAAVGVGMGAFHSGSVAAALVASVVGASYLLARTIFGGMAHRRGEELQQLMSRLVDRVSATATPASAPTSPAIERPAERNALERGE